MKKPRFIIATAFATLLGAGSALAADSSTGSGSLLFNTTGNSTFNTTGGSGYYGNVSTFGTANSGTSSGFSVNRVSVNDLFSSTSGTASGQGSVNTGVIPPTFPGQSADNQSITVNGQNQSGVTYGIPRTFPTANNTPGSVVNNNNSRNGSRVGTSRNNTLSGFVNARRGNATSFNSGGNGSTLNNGSANATGFGAGTLSFDRQFIRRAAADNLLEIWTSQLALTNAQSSAVREYAAKLIQDHTAAFQQLQALAEELGITIPTSTSNQVSTLRRFNASGANFDRQYVLFNIQAHSRSIDLHELEARRGSNAEVRAFAREQLVPLAHHLQGALELAETLQLNGRTTSAVPSRTLSSTTR